MRGPSDAICARAASTASLVPVDHQITQTDTRRAEKCGRNERRRDRPAHIAVGPVDLVHLGAQQQIGEGAPAAIPQRPQPSDQQRSGVEQMRHVAQHQAAKSGGGTVGSPDRNAEDRAPQRPTPDPRQHQSIDCDQHENQHSRAGEHPPQPATLRRGQRQQRHRRDHRNAQQHVDRERACPRQPGCGRRFGRRVDGGRFWCCVEHSRHELT